MKSHHVFETNSACSCETLKPSAAKGCAERSMRRSSCSFSGDVALGDSSDLNSGPESLKCPLLKPVFVGWKSRSPLGETHFMYISPNRSKVLAAPQISLLHGTDLTCSLHQWTYPQLPRVHMQPLSAAARHSWQLGRQKWRHDNCQKSGVVHDFL